MSILDLYQDMIIDHGKNPRNFGNLPHANFRHEGHNPLCGDRFMLYLLEENGVIQDVRFEGSGCAISVASASLLSEFLKEKKLSEFEPFFESFHDLLTVDKEPKLDLGKLSALRGVAQYPIRVKCATLPWHTVKAALQKDQTTARTE